MTPVHIAMALAPIVPEIVRWITGGDEKSTEVAQKVVDVAEAVTGVKGMGAVEMIRAKPEVMVAFRTRVMEIDAEMERTYLADRQDARKRDIELAKAGRTSNSRANWMVAMAAIGTVSGFVGMCVLGYLKAKHPEALNDGVFGALLAQLSTITAYFGLCLRDAFQFEFGSSRGSKEKGDAQAEMMAEIAKGMRK